jgi:hypothetical protein
MTTTTLPDGVSQAMVNHLTANAKYYAHKILIPEHHQRLVQNLASVAQTAHIPPQYIYRYSMADHCTQAELDWVRTLHSHEDEDCAGLIYEGKQPKLDQRMMTMAGAFIRNYIDARVYPVQDIVQMLKRGKKPEGTIILVPNFFLTKENGGHVATWEVSALLGWLYDRYGSSQQTVLYVQSLTAVEQEYGTSFKDHIDEHFQKL